MFWLNCVSVSDTPGMVAKQETGPVEKGTDCGFASTIKSGEHLLTYSDIWYIQYLYENVIKSGTLISSHTKYSCPLHIALIIFQKLR